MSDNRQFIHAFLSPISFPELMGFLRIPEGSLVRTGGPASPFFLLQG